MGKSILLLIIIGAAALQALSQEILGNEVARRENERIQDQKRTEAEETRIRERVSGQQSSFEAWNRMVMRRNSGSSIYYGLSQKEKKEIKEIRRKLEPNAEDFAKYESFLKQSKTGLFRLMPNRDCAGKYVVKVDENCENSALLGEYYSFGLNDYASNEWFDLTFKDGELSSRGLLSQTLLASLGDIPLENLSPASKGVKYIADFFPLTENNAVKKQFAALTAGVDFDGYKYSKSAKATPDNTYVMRVITYRLEDKIYFRFRRKEPTTEDQKILVAGGFGKKEDIIVAFRIVRQDADGSLSILWKELARKKSPKITFEKNEPLSGIEEVKQSESKR